ncbi:acyl carrier protein [Nocardiopsis akebiae]|uniref:Acyl carrier protein n=1 Tax=Nocardiopsis akebiae TaxID=2831968 RepID=A0ABX8C7A3_9ACTN|nr:phosphopantetheine-binding protein [Nocardiopsis akebiae]QUX29317.1 acyl carrier protein [Nocardiopsis akebiae]
MTKDASEQEVRELLLLFVRDRFLDGDPHGELTEDSPLREWGVLTSLNTAVLMNHIHTGLGVPIRAERIDPRAFTDVRSIAAMLCAGRAGEA